MGTVLALAYSRAPDPATGGIAAATIAITIVGIIQLYRELHASGVRKRRSRAEARMILQRLSFELRMLGTDLWPVDDWLFSRPTKVEGLLVTIGRVEARFDHLARLSVDLTDQQVDAIADGSTTLATVRVQIAMLRVPPGDMSRQRRHVMREIEAGMRTLEDIARDVDRLIGADHQAAMSRVASVESARAVTEAPAVPLKEGEQASSTENAE